MVLTVLMRKTMLMLVMVVIMSTQAASTKEQSYGLRMTTPVMSVVEVVT